MTREEVRAEKTQKELKEILGLFDVLRGTKEITTDEVLNMETFDSLKKLDYKFFSKVNESGKTITTVFKD